MIATAAAFHTDSAARRQVLLCGVDRVVEARLRHELELQGHHVTSSAAHDAAAVIAGSGPDLIITAGAVYSRIDRLVASLQLHTVPLPPSHVIGFGDVVVDVSARTVVRHGTPVHLRPRAFDLLVALGRRAGQVAHRLELLHEVWGYASGVVSRTVDVHVVELRQKLEPLPRRPQHILTVPKAGYRLVS